MYTCATWHTSYCKHTHTNHMITYTLQKHSIAGILNFYGGTKDGIPYDQAANFPVSGNLCNVQDMMILNPFAQALKGHFKRQAL